jgi:hypothetical protein
MVVRRSSSLNVAYEMGAYGLLLRETEKECTGGSPFPLRIFSDYGTRTAQVERYGLSIGGSFARVSVADGRPIGGSC